MDADTLPTARAAWLMASKLLIAKANLLKGGDAAAGLAALRAERRDLSAVRDEADLQRVVEARVILAEALEGQGLAEEAQAEWAWIAALGYPRLYATDLWLAARRRVSE